MNTVLLNISSQSLTINLGLGTLWVTFPNYLYGMGVVLFKPEYNKFTNAFDDRVLWFKTRLSDRCNKAFFDAVAVNHKFKKLEEDDIKRKAVVTQNLTFSDYQAQAKKTAIYPDQYKVMYPVLGLAGEAGEVANKVKKIYRDKDGVFSPEDIKEIVKELNGCTWYLAACHTDLGADFGEGAQDNLDILHSRMERGVLKGSGDNR